MVSQLQQRLVLRGEDGAGNAHGQELHVAVLDGAKKLHQVPVHIVGGGVAATADAVTATSRFRVCRSQNLVDACLDGRQVGVDVDGRYVKFRARPVQNVGGGRIECQVAAHLGRQLQGGRAVQGQ